MPPAVHSHWAQLTLCQTRVRLLQAEGAWPRADAELQKAIELAASQNDWSWQLRFSLLRLKGLVATRDFFAASRLLAELDLEPQTLDALCQRTSILGIASVVSGREQVGFERIRRAERIAVSSGNVARSADASELGKLFGLKLSDLELDTAAMAPSPDLDTAVALIELGGHPHILGREALAVLDAAGCAQAAALVADGAGRPARRRGARLDRSGSGGRGRRAPDQYDTDPARPPPRRALAARRRPAPGARPPLHAHRHPQADRHRAHARPLSPRREAARRAVAGRGARRRPREHLGLRADGRAAQRRAAHRADPALRPADRRNRHRQGDAGARHPPRLRSRRPPAPAVQLHRRAARHAREPAVRLPQGGLHRRRHLVPRRHPLRRRRHAVPRRDRRRRPRRPAEAAALPRDPRDPPARRAAARSRSTSASSPRPTPASNSSSPTAGSARTSSTASTSSASSCRRCASGARRSRRSSITTSGSSATNRRRAG